MKKEKKKSFSVSTKLNLIIFSILFFFGLCTMIISFYIIKNSKLADMNHSLHDSTLIIASSSNKELIRSAIDNPNEKNLDVLQLTKDMDFINDKSSIITNLNLISSVDGQYYAPVLSSSLLDTGVPYNPELKSLGISEEYIATLDKVFQTKQVASTEIYGDKYGQYKTGFAPILDSNGEILALYAIDYDVSSVTKDAWGEALKVIYLTLIFLVFTAFFTRFTIRKTFAPINKLSELSVQVAAGNLDVEPIQINSNDEIGVLTKNYNSMISNIKKIIVNVQTVSAQVEASSISLSSRIKNVGESTDQIVHAMQQISSSTEQQVASTSQSTKIIEEMNTGILRTSDSALLISESAIKTSKDAEIGNQTTKRTVEQMTIISQTVKDSAHLVRSLDEHSERIESIVKIITSIATQTNLLALNAAIEAARAGEHGKGFAVVADEVRKLAEQSEESTRKISEILNDIQTMTSETVQTMKMAVQEVENGIINVNESEKAFNQILNSINHVSLQIQDITATFEEISAGTEEVTQSVQTMESVSITSNTSISEITHFSLVQLDMMKDMTKEAEILKDLAEKLQNKIEIFKVNDTSKGD